MINKRIISNANWIICCKIIQSLIQLIVGTISARYLGPANYGLINYAAAIVAFVIPVMQLGLKATLVQEYVDSPNECGKILGTQMVLNTVSAGACVVGVVLFALAANPGDYTTIWVCALYSLSLVSQASEMLQYWFQAKLLSKYSSIAMLFAYVIASAYKIYLLIAGKSVYWFALSHAVEYAASGLLLFCAYVKYGTEKICFSPDLAKKLLSKGKNYISAAIMVEAYLRIGNVLLKSFCGEAENGYYAAAVTCTCITGFVYSAIIDTARPVILNSKKENQATFEKNIACVYSLVICLTLVQSIVFTIFSKVIVWILYGSAYSPAVRVLQILSWNMIFAYIGTVRNIWILGEEKHTELWKINLGGAIASLILNLLLIPKWGACGAAVATVLVQIFTNVIMGYILKPIRRNNYLILRGLNPKLAVDLVKTFLAR